MFNILVVDDEKAVRETIGKWFSMKGFYVILAADGQDAVNEVNSAETPFDVIIMDLEMPKMGGLEAIKQIKSSNKDLPIIAVTGYSESAHKVISVGASLILGKPLKLKDLESEARRLISE